MTQAKPNRTEDINKDIQKPTSEKEALIVVNSSPNDDYEMPLDNIKLADGKNWKLGAFSKQFPPKGHWQMVSWSELDDTVKALPNVTNTGNGAVVEIDGLILAKMRMETYLASLERASSESLKKMSELVVEPAHAVTSTRGSQVDRLIEVDGEG